MQLEVLGLDVAEDQDVVRPENLLVSAGGQVVELPGRHVGHLVATTRFQGLLQPFAVVVELEALPRVIERSLREQRAAPHGPVADVVNLRHCKASCPTEILTVTDKPADSRDFAQFYVAGPAPGRGGKTSGGRGTT